MFYCSHFGELDSLETLSDFYFNQWFVSVKKHWFTFVWSVARMQMIGCVKHEIIHHTLFESRENTQSLFRGLEKFSGKKTRGSLSLQPGTGATYPNTVWSGKQWLKDDFTGDHDKWLVDWTISQSRVFVLITVIAWLNSNINQFWGWLLMSKWLGVWIRMKTQYRLIDVNTWIACLFKRSNHIRIGIDYYHP